METYSIPRYSSLTILQLVCHPASPLHCAILTILLTAGCHVQTRAEGLPSPQLRFRTCKQVKDSLRQEIHLAKVCGRQPEFHYPRSNCGELPCCKSYQLFSPAALSVFSLITINFDSNSTVQKKRMECRPKSLYAWLSLYCLALLLDVVVLLMLRSLLGQTLSLLCGTS